MSLSVRILCHCEHNCTADIEEYYVSHIPVKYQHWQHLPLSDLIALNQFISLMLLHHSLHFWSYKSALSGSPYLYFWPSNNYTYGNIITTIKKLLSAVNFNWRDFFSTDKFSHGTLLKACLSTCHSLPFHKWATQHFFETTCQQQNKKHFSISNMSVLPFIAIDNIRVIIFHSILILLKWRWKKYSRQKGGKGDNSEKKKMPGSTLIWEAAMILPWDASTAFLWCFTQSMFSWHMYSNCLFAHFEPSTNTLVKSTQHTDPRLHSVNTAHNVYKAGALL